MLSIRHRIVAVETCATHERSSKRAFQWCVVVGCAGVLLGAPAAYAQELSIRPGNALRNLSTDQADRQRTPPVLSPPGAPVSPSTSAADGERFVLLGVVIAEDRRLALLHPAATPDAARLVPLGDSFEDHRLVDVQSDHVTLQGRGGERLLVRLASGHGARATAPPTPATSTVRSETSGATQIDARSREVKAKEARQQQIDDATARDKARALAERFLSGGASPGPANH